MGSNKRRGLAALAMAFSASSGHHRVLSFSVRPDRRSSSLAPRSYLPGIVNGRFHPLRRQLVTTSGRRKRSRDDGPPRPKRQLQRSPDGLPPEVARTYPEQYEALLKSKVDILTRLMEEATSCSVDDANDDGQSGGGDA